MHNDIKSIFDELKHFGTINNVNNIKLLNGILLNNIKSWQSYDMNVQFQLCVYICIYFFYTNVSIYVILSTILHSTSIYKTK